MFGLGIWELVAIVIVILIVFGPGRLPELGSGLGEGIKNFKKAYRDSKAIDASPGANSPGSGESASNIDANKKDV